MKVQIQLFISIVISTCVLLISCRESAAPYVGVTVIPFGKITDKVDIDIRSGIVNNDTKSQIYTLSVSIHRDDSENTLYSDTVELMPGKAYVLKNRFPATSYCGKYSVKIEVKDRSGKSFIDEDSIRVIPSEVRSPGTIDGAWAGIYHWSEQEGLHWNKDIAAMNDEQWKELVRAMHSIGMDAVVIQEVFRNQAYVNEHTMNLETYTGKAFYPSKLYPARMDMITADDPVEAILSEADVLGMKVFVGVGMFAWFDFSPASLEWHMKVARELWDLYGWHKSFYGFYISEEADGSLATGVSESRKEEMRNEMVEFFSSFRAWTETFAPDKPIMLATNSMNVRQALDVYPKLLENLDVLCPFGFARMPEGDLTGKEAADLLQGLCDNAGAHLWFDLEAFLFNPDMSLYPRPISQIISDLNLLDNFEKVLCYQFPGVFNSPDMSVRIGEERTLQLYQEYKEYLTNHNK